MPTEPGAIRIGLIGGECTGKSTLAQELALRLQDRLGPGAVHVVDERLREFVATHGRPPRPDEQAGLMLAQRAAEDLAAASSQVVIADPATMLTAVYSELYFDDLRLWPQAAEQARAYALLLWCRPDIPWEPDPPQRDGPGYRQAADEIIARVLGPGPDRLVPGGPIRQVRGTGRMRIEPCVTHAIAALDATGAWHRGEPGNRT